MITITQEPIAYSPIKNELVYVMSGGNSSNFGHLYLVDIYSASSNTFIKRMQVPKVPNTVFGVADVHKILSDYVRPERDIISGGTPFFNGNNSFINYYVLVGEQYEKWRYDDYYFDAGRVLFSSATQKHGLVVGDVIRVSQDVPYTFQEYQGIQTVYSVVDEYAIVIDETFQSGPPEGGVIGKDNGEPLSFSAVTTGSTKTAWNTAIDYDEWVDYDPSDYVYKFPVNAVKTLSTNAPREDWWMRLSGQMFLYQPQFSAITSTPIEALYVFTYNEQGALVGNYLVNHSACTTTDPFYLGIGPKDIVNSTEFSVLSGPSTIINDAVAYYELFTADFAPPQSERIRINLDRTCTQHEVFDILFMDKKGTLNTFSFYLRNDRKMVIKKDQYHKSKGNLVNGVWTNSRQDRGLSTYNVDSSREFIIRTELMNEECSHYLEDLLESPYVYRIVGNYFIPIIIKDGTYTIYNERDKVFLYEMSIADANYRINLL